MAAGGSAPSRQQPCRRFAFIFPMASGHINPSFPIARRLVELGHEVHYLCREQMREAVLDTGATFHSEIEHQPELYAGREVDLLGAMDSLRKEHGLGDDPFVVNWARLRYVQLEIVLPGTMRWLRQVGAEAVVFCPLMNLEASYAAQAVGLPSVALLTMAGPGAMRAVWQEFWGRFGLNEADIRRVCETYEPHLAAVRRLNETYGFSIQVAPNMAPFGKMDVLRHSFVTLVTTCKELEDPVAPEVEAAYAAEGVRFEAVGPLLDKGGARRAAGHTFIRREAGGERPASEAAEEPAAGGEPDAEEEVLAKVRAARAAGRGVVLVSMGTVLTGDSKDFGWTARTQGPDGRPRGLSGRELCQGAWAGAFDAFGREAAHEGPLLVVALGPQALALGELRAPANAICTPVVPQVDVLKCGVDVFLTHGGQNSFMEGLTCGAPLVVCPGVADQPANARKAEAIGVGLQVPRPDPDAGGEAAAAARYRSDVAAALRRVASDAGYRAKAAEYAERLRSAGGVPRAAELVIAAAASRDRAARGHKAPLQGEVPCVPNVAGLAGA